jgi:hypothetical protein
MRAAGKRTLARDIDARTGAYAATGF